MNIDEVIQQPGQRERLLKQDILNSVHVSMPGEIVSYNSETRTATIQPVIRDWGSTENPPLLTDVPVFMWGNYTFTPHAGDGCLVVFADSAIDSWLQKSGVGSPVVSRTHSLSDGFAFCGFNQSEGTDLGEIVEDAEEALEAAEEALEEVEGFQEQLDGKAPAIIIESDPKNVFTPTELATYGDYTIKSNTEGHSSVYVMYGVDLYLPTDSATGTHYAKTEGRTVVWNGTLTSQEYYLARVNGTSAHPLRSVVPAGTTINLFVSVEGSETHTASNLGEMQFQFLKSDESSMGNKYTTIPSSGSSTVTYTPSYDVHFVRVYVWMNSGDVFDNFKVTWGGSLVKTYASVPGGGEIAFTKEQTLATGLSILPVSASVQYVADTKTYIDNNVPSDVLKWKDLVYLSPEMFGAKGDGTVNDATAVQNCINAAITAGKPVRGYGTYRVDSTIVIDGTYVDVFLKRVNYTGSSAGVTIAGKNNTLRIDFLFAQNTGASGIAVVEPTSTDSTEKIMISGVCIYSHTHAMVLNSPNAWMTYVVIRYKMLYTATKSDPYGYCDRDAIYATGHISEVAVYDVTFACQNGWCFNGPTVKFFNCTMEHNVWGGVYAGGATIQNCRARELMDCLMPTNIYHDASSGILFKIKSGNYTTPGINITIDDTVYYDALDMADAQVLDTGNGNASLINAYFGMVHCPICIGDLNYKYGEYFLGKEMILHGKDKVCVPSFRGVIHITVANCDLRDPGVTTLTSVRLPYPYKFIIDVSDCVIRLSPSYCSEGYDEFVVDMSSHLATVYDRRGNLIFDPTNATSGVYKFTALVDDTIDNTYQTAHTLTNVYPINSGYCDVWTVTQIS